MAPWFCGSCGRGLRDGARFCGGCGAPVAEESPKSQGGRAARSPMSPINAKSIGALLAAFFVLFSVLGSENRRKATIDFIDDNLYAPVSAITPRDTIPEFYKRVRRPCTDVDALDGGCHANSLFSMLFRVPSAMLGTAGYVLSQGPVAAVGIPVLIFAAIIVAGLTEDPNPGVIFNPMNWIFIWLVSFPLFTGLVAWGLQLLILILLLMLKSLIAALACMGVFYFVFEKLTLWDEMQKLFERGMNRVTGKKAPRQAA